MTALTIAAEIAALGGGAWLAAHAVRGSAARPIEARARVDRRAGPPEQLERLERAVFGGASNAGDLHLVLRPVLREIAVERLRRRGIELDRRTEAAHALLGDELWELVRADRPRPRDAFAAGLTLSGVEGLIERLERV
jgi:hypothetical protein